MTRQDGTTPLNLAAYADAKTALLLLDHGARPDTNTSKSSPFPVPLVMSAARGDVELCTRLIQVSGVCASYMPADFSREGDSEFIKLSRVGQKISLEWYMTVCRAVAWLLVQLALLLGMRGLGCYSGWCDCYFSAGRVVRVGKLLFSRDCLCLDHSAVCCRSAVLLPCCILTGALSLLCCHVISRCFNRLAAIRTSCTPQRALRHCMQLCPQRLAGRRSSACCWRRGQTSTCCAAPTPSGAL